MTVTLTPVYYETFDDFATDTGGVTIEEAIERSFRADPRGAGEARITARLAAMNLPGTDGVVAYDVSDGDTTVRAFQALVGVAERTPVSTDGPKGEIGTWVMPGPLARFQECPIRPPNGEQVEPIADSFTFNYTHPGYDESDPLSPFVPATEVCTLADAQASWGGFTSPDAFDPDMLDGSDTKVIWASDGTQEGIGVGVGKCCFRDTFIAPYSGRYFFDTVADNAFTGFINAASQVSAGSSGTAEKSAFRHASHVEVTLVGGVEYVVAFEVDNYAPLAPKNPGGLASWIGIPGFETAHIVWRTSSATRVAEYVDELPGMSPNTVVRLIVESGQDLGAFDGIDLSTFDDYTDSNGAETTLRCNVSASIGDSSQDVIEKLQQSYMDARFNPSSWSFEVYNLDTMAGSSGVTFDAAENVTSLTHKTEPPVATGLLIKSRALGYSLHGEGPRWKYLELGIEVTAQEVDRIAATLLGIFGQERRELTLSAVPRSAGPTGEVPWLNPDFVPLSTSIGPWITGTLEAKALTLGLAQSEGAETVQVLMTLNDKILDVTDRIVRELTAA